MFNYFCKNKNELGRLGKIITGDDEYPTDKDGIFKKTFDAEKEGKAAINLNLDKDGADTHKRRKDQVQNNVSMAAYKWHGASSLLIAATVIYGAKLGYTYLEQKLTKPQFCEATNDKGSMQNIIDSIFGSTDEFLRRDENDKLLWNPEQKEIVDNIQIDYMQAMELDQECTHYLFYGPQGTGKTSLALQLAYETDSIYYIIKASSFLEKDGPSNFTHLMRRVKQQGSRPIIFIDEADDLISHSSAKKGRRLTVFNSMLSEIQSNSRLCTFIFTTNLPDNIDERMMDRLEPVQFVNPNMNTRKEMIAEKLEYYFTDPVGLGGLPAEIEYDEITPEIIKIMAEKTKDWSCRGYAKFVTSLRKSLVRKDEFVCTAQNLLDHVDYINRRNSADAIAKIQLRDQFTHK
ncbi:AAA family ATPase [Candidatus Babeliales bacterium]|nr:AAA family ATPase [Candidatus Babeliales bacterium]